MTVGTIFTMKWYFVFVMRSVILKMKGVYMMCSRVFWSSYFVSLGIKSFIKHTKFVICVIVI